MIVASLLLIGCSDSPSGPTIGPAVRLLVLDGANQTGVVGQPTSVMPSVLAIDANNQPVPGVIVTFTVEPGGGTIATATATTDAKGVATPGVWTLANSFAVRTLTATAAGLQPVTFTARGIAPDAGIPAFNLTDPAGDTLGVGPTSARPKAHDVLGVRGDYKRDSVIVVFTFGGPVTPVSSGPEGVGGVLEIDIDNNGSTGARAFSNSFGATSSIGVEYVVDLFSATATSTRLSTPAGDGPGVTVPASFSGSTLTVRIPLQLLGNDDGNFAFVGTIGTVDRPTDIFPNSGAGTARPGGGTAVSSLQSDVAAGTPRSIPVARARWAEMARSRLR